MYKIGKIGYKLLKTSKTSEERQIYVIHRYKDGDDYQKTTCLSVHPKYFDLKSGKVKGIPAAPEMNKAIQALVNTLETASRNVIERGGEPTKTAVKTEFEALVAQHEMRLSLKPQAEKILGSILDTLYEELADLEAAVVAKKQEIEAEEIQQGLFKSMLITTYIDKYIEERKDTLAKNSIRLFPNLKDWVIKFDPTWRIDNVNRETLTAFQNFLIQSDKLSGTIADLITKLKTVVRHFANQLKLDLNELADFKLGFKKKRNDNVVYLNKEQLVDLMNLDLEGLTTTRTLTMCRDIFCLMSLTGLRWVDSYVKPEQIVDGHIRVITDKTDTDLLIPLSTEAEEILDRLLTRKDYTPQVAQHFNKRIKDICAMVPSIANKKELVKEYKGQNKASSKEYEYKHTLITCHTGRRTFINLALLAGVPAPTIASIVGHEGTELIMKTYSNKDVGKDKLKELLK